MPATTPLGLGVRRRRPVRDVPRRGGRATCPTSWSARSPTRPRGRAAAGQGVRRPRAALAAAWSTTPASTLVVVATPPADARRDRPAALGAGRHVFCEKPLATDRADLDGRVAAAAARGRRARRRPRAALQPAAGRRSPRLQERAPRPRRSGSCSRTTPATRTSPPTTGSGTRGSAAASSSSTACTSSTPPRCSSADAGHRRCRRCAADVARTGLIDLVSATAHHGDDVLATHTHSLHPRAPLRAPADAARLRRRRGAHRRLDPARRGHRRCGPTTPGAPRCEALPADAELLRRPGFRPARTPRITVDVRRDAAPRAPAAGARPEVAAPRPRPTSRSAVRGQGEPSYAESVRAAIADLGRASHGAPAAQRLPEGAAAVDRRPGRHRGGSRRTTRARPIAPRENPMNRTHLAVAATLRRRRCSSPLAAAVAGGRRPAAARGRDAAPAPLTNLAHLDFLGDSGHPACPGRPHDVPARRERPGSACCGPTPTTRPTARYQRRRRRRPTTPDDRHLRPGRLQRRRHGPRRRRLPAALAADRLGRQPRRRAYELLRGLTYLQTATGPNAGNVVLWMQPDGTLNPSADPRRLPDPSDSDASYWLARTIWALGEGYAAFQHADPALRRASSATGSTSRSPRSTGRCSPRTARTCTSTAAVRRPG